MVLSDQDLEANRIFLLMAESSKLRNLNITVAREMVLRQYHVVMVSATLPYSVMMKLYEQACIPHSSITVIDLVTLYSGGTSTDIADRCRFVSNPANLTAIGISITETLNQYGDDRVCLVFDEVSTMLLYAPSMTITKFLHFISSKLRILDIPGIFLAAEKGLDPTLLAQISTFTDRVIHHAPQPPS